jgi:hypothetical protein
VEDLKDNPDAANRLRTAAAGVYLGAFYESPNATSPRERLQRGQFQDAAKDLVSKQDMFARGRAQLRGNREAQQAIRDWVARAKDLYDELGRAGLSGDKEAQAAARARAASDIGLHWRSPVAGLLVNQIVADIGQAEATFLLALCKHEQAERLQARLDHAAGTDIADLKQRAADAWGNALGEWRTYEGHADLQKGFPGREAHAEMLKARAEKLAAPK